MQFYSKSKLGNRNHPFQLKAVYIVLYPMIQRLDKTTSINDSVFGLTQRQISHGRFTLSYSFFV